MATRDIQPDEAGAQPVDKPAPKFSRALAGLKRELTDEELDSPGAKKLLLDYLERIQEENDELKSIRNKYYEVDKQLGVLQEKFKTNTAVEAISVGTITVGAAMLVYVPELWAHQPAGWFTGIFGFILVGIGIIAKWIRL